MSDSYIKSDPDLGIPLYTVYDGKVEFSEFMIKRAAVYVKHRLAKNIEALHLMGAAGKCPLCLESGINYDHCLTLPHAVYCLGVPAQWVAVLLELACKKFTDDAMPVVKGDNLGPLFIWRGFFVVADESGPSITGATGAKWESGRLQATCHGDRQTCIEHLTGSRKLEITCFIQRDLVKLHYSASNYCSCGIYGFNKYQLLLNQRDRFTVITECVIGGAAIAADDGLRASDARIERAWIIKENLNKLLAEYLRSYFNWRKFAEDLSAKYDAPFGVTDSYTSLDLWLQVETMSREMHNAD